MVSGSPRARGPQPRAPRRSARRPAGVLRLALPRRSSTYNRVRLRPAPPSEPPKVLVESGVPAGRVNSGREVFEHPQLKLNGVVMETRHPRAGRLRMMGFPLRLTRTPARLRRHAPALGADTRAVLRDLGYRPAEIRRLVGERVVRGR